MYLRLLGYQLPELAPLGTDSLLAGATRRYTSFSYIHLGQISLRLDFLVSMIMSHSSFEQRLAKSQPNGGHAEEPRALSMPLTIPSESPRPTPHTSHLATGVALPTKVQRGWLHGLSLLSKPFPPWAQPCVPSSFHSSIKAFVTSKPCIPPAYLAPYPCT